VDGAGDVGGYHAAHRRVERLRKLVLAAADLCLDRLDDEGRDRLRQLRVVVDLGLPQGVVEHAGDARREALLRARALEHEIHALAQVGERAALALKQQFLQLGDVLRHGQALAGN
jgi:hypothetical protein